MQNHPLLLPVKIDLFIVRDGLPGDGIAVEEPFHRLAVTQVGLDYLRHIFFLDFGIKDPFRLHHDDGPLFAKTMAAGIINGDPGQAKLVYPGPEQFVELPGAAGLAPRPAADQNLTPGHGPPPSS